MSAINKSRKIFPISTYGKHLLKTVVYIDDDDAPQAWLSKNKAKINTIVRGWRSWWYGGDE